MSNRLVTVSPGEVCSIDIAKRLGIFDAEFYYKPEFISVKKYDGTAEDNARPQRICSVNTFRNESSPLCITSPNAQPGFTTTKQRGMPTNTCQTYSCPPGFEDQGNSCKKPTERRVIALSERVDERWEDWFTIPNYNLGNTFAKVESTNYKPCKPGQVPYYAKDPVDGERMDWTSKDALGRCVDKDVYFGGKYADTSDYCGTPMIKRFGFSLDDMYASFKRAHNKEVLSPVEEAYVNTIYELIKKEITKVESVNLENESLQRACNKDVDEKQLEETYDICDQLKNRQEAFENKFMEDSPEQLEARVLFTKYGCHNTFCPSQNYMNKAAAIDRDPICFDDVSQQMIEESLRKYKQQLIDNNQELPPITAKPEKEKFKTTLKYTAFVLMTLFVIILLIIVWNKLGRWRRMLFNKVKGWFNPVLGYTLTVLLPQELEEEFAKEDLIQDVKKKERKAEREAKRAARQQKTADAPAV